MLLRQLQPGDAPFMLEWMHDLEIVQYMGKNFGEKDLNDCLQFIDAAKSDSQNLHYAVVDENGRYMGTVSLKHLGLVPNTAEFAITLRRCAMGKGYAQYAISKIFEYGSEKYGIKQVLWCVKAENARAIHFYDKRGYPKADCIPVCYSELYLDDTLIWYAQVNP